MSRRFSRNPRTSDLTFHRHTDNTNKCTASVVDEAGRRASERRALLVDSELNAEPLIQIEIEKSISGFTHGDLRDIFATTINRLNTYESHS